MRESAEQILAAYRGLGLEARRQGVQWEGPCPSCGGENRFHVSSDGMIGCRNCGDFRAIATALGLNGGAPAEVDTDALERTRVEAERRYARAADRARQMIGQCRRRPHPYLARKGFGDVRALVLDGRIAVPVYGRAGLQSLQLIAGDGSKRFLAGGKMAGGHAVLGPCDPRGRWWHVEGLATGLSVRRALQSLSVPDCVIICFSAGGLAVAKDCRRALVVADHDESGAGQQAAERVACPWWMPPEIGDANDYEQAHGTGALAAALRPLMMGRDEDEARREPVGRRHVMDGRPASGRPHRGAGR